MIELPARVIVKMTNGTHYVQEFLTDRQAEQCYDRVLETLLRGEMLNLREFRRPEFRGNHVALPVGISEVIWEGTRSVSDEPTL